MKRFFKVVLIIIVVLVVLLVGANLYIKHYLNSDKFRGLLAESVEKAVHRDLSIGRISYSVFPPSIIVQEVVLKEPDGKEDFVSLQEFSLLVDLGKREITHILLQKPSVRIVQYADGTFNFTDMIPEPPTETNAPVAADTAAAAGKPADHKTKAPAKA
jgi:uncharacterized protein involved in outer membrane biogenesis